MVVPNTELNFEDAIDYHYGQFPPTVLNYEQLIEPLGKAADALARFDQVLKDLHNSEFLIAPLKNQEAILSSRIEGIISTMDEVLQYKADHDVGGEEANKKADVIETILYQGSLKYAQSEIKRGTPILKWLI